jgi:hypothetical protein
VSSEIITPADEMTGIPLPLMPRNDLPPVPTGNMRNLERVADWHHPFHPRSILIHEGLGPAAVRNCRIQWANYVDHHHRYHAAYKGPELPITDNERFNTVVFAAAGYVPDRAISFEGRRRPVFKRLNDEDREQLWRNGQLRVANQASVQTFLTDYVLRQDFGGINETTIDEFLHTSDLKRKRELGGTLLGIAAYDAAAPLRNTYQESRKLHLIPPDRARTAGRFIFGAMTAHRSRALGALTSRLATA